MRRSSSAKKMRARDKMRTQRRELVDELSTAAQSASRPRHRLPRLRHFRTGRLQLLRQLRNQAQLS